MNPNDAELAALVEMAGRGGGLAPEALAAQARLESHRLGDDAALRGQLAALGQVSPTARAAAGLWLFSPQGQGPALLGQLARQAEAVLGLACQFHPPEWTEGLAVVLALAGGGALRRLAGLARDEDWAREVLAALPAGLRLPDGDSASLRLHRLLATPAGVRRAQLWASQERWQDLAALAPPELDLARHTAGWRPAAAGSEALVWPGGDLALLEEMAAITAQEGRRAYELARELARERGRPVILMGNASLGGPPLWATPGPWQQGAEWRARLAPPPAGPLRELGRLRAARLAGPRLTRALWQMACAVAVHGRGRTELGRLVRAAAPWLAPGQAQGVLAGALPLAPAGPPLDQALERVQEALALARSLAAENRRVLSLAWGYLAAWGRSRQPLVLPWADKFVISTQKAGDWAYLSGILGFLGRLTHPPLVLLIDETIHPPNASLSMVLERIRLQNPGLALAGLGAMADQEEPPDLAAALSQAAREARLVAFRPQPGPHPCANLDQRLAGRQKDLPLTPASRDGANWLLAGTQLAALAGGEPPHAGSMAQPATWLLTKRGFTPLGLWWRRRIMTLAGREIVPEGHWQSWQRAFNLA